MSKAYTKYKQYRIARRYGDIVQQNRTVTVYTKHKHPLWQFWNWGVYECNYEYSEWEDVPIPVISEWRQND